MPRPSSRLSLNGTKEDQELPANGHGIGVTLSQEDLYLANCERYHLPVDASILTTLRTRWFLLSTTSSRRSNANSGGGCALLPLMNVLENNDHVTHVQLHASSSSSEADVNMRALSSILRKNTTITSLNLKGIGLTDVGVSELSEAIKTNSSLLSINLSSNSFGETGAASLRDALEVNTSLTSLDLSCNALGFLTIDMLRCSCARRRNHTILRTNGNYVFEEILNAVSHGVGFVLSLIGAFVLVSEAATTYNTDYHFWACVVYSLSLILLFLFSSLFHAFFMMPQTSQILQILDHVGIYLLIAGTITPFLLISLHHIYFARLVLIGDWLAAFAGIVFASCSDLNKMSTNAVELVVFIGMGASCILVYDALLVSLPYEALLLLAGGCAVYVVGIIFFILGEFKPIYHVIWHLFVLLAALMHWFCIYFFVVNTRLDILPTILSSFENRRFPIMDN